MNSRLVSTLALMGFLLLTLFMLFKSDPEFQSVDKRVYTYYSVSLIEDFDFNIINQVPRKEAWLLTSTLNYPDLHSNGVGVLWAPFIALGIWIGKLTGSNPDHAIRVAQSTANVVWGLLALPLMWRILRRRYSSAISFATLSIIALCTPYLFYLTEQPENADITSLFVTAAVLELYLQRHRIGDRFFPFLLGLAVFFGAAVKFEAICDGILFLAYLYECRGQDLKKLVKVIVLFSAGAVISLAPIIINDSLKDGYLNFTHFDTFSPHTFVLWEFLFAPSGYLVTSPFFAVLLLGAAWFGISRRDSAEPSPFIGEDWLFLSAPLIKVVLASFDYNQNETIGARPWVNSLPFFALILAGVLNRLTTPLRKAVFGVLCILSWGVSLMSVAVYRHDFDAYFFTGKDWPAIAWNYMDETIANLYEPRWVEMKFVLLPVIALGLVAVAFGSKAILRFKSDRGKTLASAFILAVALYWVATLGNIVNNRKSAEQTHQDVIAQAVIGRGPEIHSIFENLGCIERSVRFYKERGDFERAEHRQRLMNEYVTRAAAQIVVDPVGFKQRLTPGKTSYLPKILWAD